MSEDDKEKGEKTSQNQNFRGKKQSRNSGKSRRGWTTSRDVLSFGNEKPRRRFSSSFRSSRSSNGVPARRHRDRKRRKEHHHVSSSSSSRVRNGRMEPNDGRGTMVSSRNVNSDGVPSRNRNIPKTPEEIVKRMGRTKKRILIELYKDSVGYKKLSKILGVGLDTIRSHIKSGKYSTSLLEIGLVERSESGGWQLTALGLQVCELLQQDPELRAFFY